MKVLSLFSGIGAFEKALDNLEIPYELVAYCEIDKYASKSYAAIHSVTEEMNLGDITKVDAKKLPKDIDLLTYGFPCQDISIAGNQKGLFNADGTQTRSGLFFEALRIIEETQPKVAIAENVKNLTSKKFALQFKIVLDSLKTAGYNNYWQVLNAKDYGVPQNRERVFIVSIRKDVDTGTFKFPEGFPLELRLKDVLEDEVDEKYYLSDKMKNYLFTVSEKNKQRNNGNVYKASDVDGISKTITTREGSRVKDNFIETIQFTRNGKVKETDLANTLTENDPSRTLGNSNPIIGVVEPKLLQVGQLHEAKVIQIGNVNPSGHGQNGTVVDSEGLARTITTEKGEGQKILVREATKKGYAEAFEGDSINLEQPNSKTRRGRVGHSVAQTLTTSPQQAVVEPLNNRSAKLLSALNEIQNNSDLHDTVIYDDYNNRIKADQSVIGTLTTNIGNDALGNGTKLIENKGLRIRKLTPKECFRLMGFDDADFEKAEAVNSNTQLYKQAGNSIVVPVLEYIIKAIADSGVWERRKKEWQISIKSSKKSKISTLRLTKKQANF